MLVGVEQQAQQVAGADCGQLLGVVGELSRCWRDVGVVVGGGASRTADDAGLVVGLGRWYVIEDVGIGILAAADDRRGAGIACLALDQKIKRAAALHQ